MMTKKNFVGLEGGLTKDPQEFENANVVHLSMAVDGAGQEKGVQYAAGYFDVKIWLNDSKYTPAALAETVKTALKEKTLKKGTKIAVMGQLKQERWEKDGQRSSKVVVIAESIEIYTPRSGANGGASAGAATGSASATADDSILVPNF